MGGFKLIFIAHQMLLDGFLIRSLMMHLLYGLVYRSVHNAIAEKSLLGIFKFCLWSMDIWISFLALYF